LVTHLAFLIGRESVGTPRMEQIVGHIQIGMQTYLLRQTSMIFSFIPLLAALIWYFLGWKTAISFVLGAIFSLLADYIEMSLPNMASIRSANVARSSPSKAFQIVHLRYHDRNADWPCLCWQVW